MKKKIIAIFSSILALSNIFVTSTYASNYDNSQYVNIDDNNINILTDNGFAKGANPPSGSSFVDLNNTDYNYKVDSLKVNVYTNSLFKGSNTINVKVGNISIDKNGMENESLPIKVYLYKKGSNKHVDSEKVGIKGGNVKFTGLDKNTYYYIGFSKANDTQIYSFSGTISN